MENAKQLVIKLSVIFILSLIFVKCANQMSPPGGEVDKIPPVILESYPENKTTNFKEDEISFSFSEYVNKRNFSEAFFISPILEKTPEFSWTNRTVYVQFPSELKDNTTYTVIIGTEIKDVNNNNNMVAPFSLTFSTGSQIDSGKISGSVFSEHKEGTMIFAYRLDSLNIDVLTNKPDYISQVNKEGFYELVGLANKRYLVLAVNDKFKDLLYNIGDDYLGVPNKYAEIKNYIPVKNLDFKLTIHDTLAPGVMSITMTDKYHIVTEFSEPIDSISLGTDNFSILDSTENKSYSIVDWYKNKPNKNEYIICVNDSLNTNNNFYLLIKGIKDKSGNTNFGETYNFVASDKVDTTSIKIKQIVTEFENNKIDYINPSFNVVFSDAIYSKDFSNVIKFFDSDSNVVNVETKKITGNSLSVKVKESLKQNTSYNININLSLLSDPGGNKSDTTIVRKVSTNSNLDFSGAMGKVISNYRNMYAVIQNTGKNKKEYKSKVDSNKTFNFEKVLPGKYLLWIFEDKDSNSIYSYGNVNPITFSEPFTYYPDTLNLRARWPVGDIEIKFNSEK